MSSSDTVHDSLVSRIYDINEKDFDTVAMEVWAYQYHFNPLYQSYCNLLGYSPLNVKTVFEIPFLPISIFRDHEVKTGDWKPEAIFRSSGTTGLIQSIHLVRIKSWYHKIAEKTFVKTFGSVQDYAWIGLLPSYLERSDSSLINMVHYFMHVEKKKESEFFPRISNQLLEVLEKLSDQNQKTILIGVSFALLDLFEKFDVPVWDNLLVIETGGMKGRGQEITREELHMRMRKKDPAMKIASEFGMTELLSQAYLTENTFKPASTMKIFIRDISDPMTLTSFGQRGAINVIDLANVDTCSFIATDDIGIAYQDGSFDVLGRLDLSDVRGCNLLYA